MGSQQFTSIVRVDKSTSDRDAFLQARDQAAYDHGHGGYTGTLAEKHSFSMIHRARSEASARRIVETLSGNGSGPIPIYRPEVIEIFDDKYGPAGAVRYPHDDKTDGVIFFGWASS